VSAAHAQETMNATASRTAHDRHQAHPARARAVLRLVPALALAAFVAGPAGAGALTPSPADWRDLVIYQVITDRYTDGNPANNAVEGQYVPADGARIHGGDFAGLEQRLDYLQHLGVDALWVSPVVLNANAEYHGYAARDFFSIAPHFGSLADLQSLAAALHARGMYLVIDVVVNHMGDLIDSGNPQYPDFQYPGTYTLRWRNASKRYFGVFDDLSKFHAHGSIGSFTDPEQVVGELFGLDDMKTEDAAVRAELTLAAQWLIDNTDCDGFRLDTVKHIEMDFWNAWTPAVHAYATAAGKERFFLFGEVFDGSDAKCGSYTGTISGGNYKLDSVLHYPMYFTATGVFAYDAPPGEIVGRYGLLTQYDTTSREQLVTFLDNHDNARFLSFGVANQDESRLHAALGWQLTSRGVPAIYYGTEQEFDGGGDPWCREDMWDGLWDFGPSEGDNFDLAHPLFRHTQSLTRVRRRHDALRRGATTTLFVENGGPGLFVYRRQSATDTVVVAVNTSNAPLARTVSSGFPPGTVLVDALDAGAVVIVAAGGSATLSVPARGVRVMESRAAHDAAPARFGVETIFPGHDQSLADVHTPLHLVFDRDVDAATLAAGFTIAPDPGGFWQVQGREARYVPAGGAWAAATTYRWSLAASVSATDGTPIGARWDADFRTTGMENGVAVPAGFVADRIARQGLAAPEGLLPAPWLGPAQMLVSDTGRDRIFTLTPGGDSGHWLGDSRWVRPEGLARSGAGQLLVVDDSGVFGVDERRIAASLASGSGASQTGACAWGSAAFGDALYLGDPANDRIARLVGASLQTFAAGIAGSEGLAFGPGEAWGTELYSSDANLTSLGTPANGTGRIVRVDAAGAQTTVASDALLLGATAIAFDTGGRFDGDLFAADIVGDRVLRITSTGSVSVFASGFNNLASSQCLAFGPDGALYVADPGSGTSFSNTNGANLPQIVRIARQSIVTDAGAGAPPGRLRLAVPTPNPAHAGATFRFELPHEGRARLALYDLAGRTRRVLADGVRPAGVHAVAWNGAGNDDARLAPGVYIVRLEMEGTAATRRLVVVR
jgi:glycosidase